MTSKKTKAVGEETEKLKRQLLRKPATLVALPQTIQETLPKTLEDVGPMTETTHNQLLGLRSTKTNSLFATQNSLRSKICPLNAEEKVSSVQ